MDGCIRPKRFIGANRDNPPCNIRGRLLILIMWQVIEYVTSGFTLCAFIVAVIASIVKARLSSERDRIKLAPEEDRAKLVARTLEFFDVDPSGLTREQQTKIALEQIQARMERFRIIARAVVILAVIGAVTSMFAVSRMSAPNSKDTSSSTSSENRNTDPSAAGGRTTPGKKPDEDKQPPTAGSFPPKLQPESRSQTDLDFSQMRLEAWLQDFSDEELVAKTEQFVRDLNTWVAYVEKDERELGKSIDLANEAKEAYALHYWPGAQALRVALSSRVPRETLTKLNVRMHKAANLCNERFLDNATDMYAVGDYLRALGAALKAQVAKKS
jgi:hypothetical protein